MKFPRRTYGALLTGWAALQIPRYGLRALRGRRVPIAARLDPTKPDGLAHAGAPRAETILHACSVGEVESARVLYEALGADGPTLVTAITETGLAAARRAGLPAAHLPFDLPKPVRIGLDAHPLRRFVILETEIWPNLLLALATRKVPTFLVSARISDRALPRYRRVRRLLVPILETFRAIGAQTDRDAHRFIEIGASASRVTVTGNLKSERPAPNPPDWPIPDRATPRLLVAGSTHAGDEEALFDALAALRGEGVPARILLAPRHLERMNEMEVAARRKGFAVGRRSRKEWDREVLLLDTHGELAAAYALSPLAFVGGTIAPVGGHNPLEAGRQSAWVLHGPRVENARDPFFVLDRVGARVVSTGGEIAAAWREAIADPAAARARGATGAEAARATEGSLARTLSLLDGAPKKRSLDSKR